MTQLHIARNYVQNLADDVDRALGFTGTFQIVVAPIGATFYEGGMTPDRGVRWMLRLCRDKGFYPMVWAYPGTNQIASGEIKLTDDKLFADAADVGAALREHLAAGGKPGTVHILTEPQDKWNVTPAGYRDAYKRVAACMPAEFVRVFAMSPLMPLSNLPAILPDEAQGFAIHPYGCKSVSFTKGADGTLTAKTQQAARTLVALEMNKAGKNLPLLIPECGVTDLDDIAASGEAAWYSYYKPLLEDIAVPYGAKVVSMLSQNWGFGSWKDGRWAPTLSVEEAMAANDKLTLAAAQKYYGFAGAPEACAILKKKLWAADVAKLPAFPFGGVA